MKTMGCRQEYHEERNMHETFGHAKFYSDHSDAVQARTHKIP